MTHQEKVDFVLSTLRPLAEATFPFLSSIVGITDGQSAKHVGSGFYCRSRSRRVLVTSAHVLDDAAQFPRYGISAGFGVPPFVLPKGSVSWTDAEADLAVLALPPAFEPPPDQKSFLDEDRIDPDVEHRYRDYLFAHGFPGSRSRFFPFEEFGKGIHSKSLPVGAMQRDPPIPGNRPFQFAMHYEPERGIAGEPGGETWLDPHGMSGSPVFRIGGVDAPIASWTPARGRLVGVVTRWDRENQALVATDAMRLMALLQRL